MTFVGRLERFAAVGSTQDVVRGWLAEGTAEVAVAVADEQLAGRGRLGRTWTAPPGAALLLSVGFRPTGLDLAHGWRLGATVALAMGDAAEAQGLRDGTVRLKWPNDLAAAGTDGQPRKLGGVLGEVEADASGRISTAVVGIGLNVDWRARDFPAELGDSMTSLRELLGRQADRDALLDDFLARLEPRYLELLDGRFDAGAWSTRQLTTGARLVVEAGSETVIGRGVGVDPESGALLLALDDGAERPIASGEVTRCRLLEAAAGSASGSADASASGSPSGSV
ncbi:MAG TPA: biotin--[acetyl-CoA-carboxylase] ligase [Candidatus Limnocylindrales bacterium]|nr:biotin--[acetyl-CoA-carboxylase] ligase [Candidatus Limnocylindrales bacterium]